MENHTHTWHWTLLAAALSMTGACGDNIESADCVPMPLSSVAQVTQGLETCPIYECGVNSAEVNDLPVGEMHITPGHNTGMVNAWGAQLIDFIAPDGTNDYIIYYADGQLFARKGDEVLAGEDLEESEFIVRDTTSCLDVHMRIHDYRQEASWTTPSFLVDSYVLTYIHPATGLEHPVCVDAGEVIESDSAWGVLVGGERYTWDTKVVRSTGAEAAGWFNIACYGNALYKMKFMGYDPDRSMDNPFETTSDQRQATLKMVTADYCGTGTSFTETGTLLYWNNAEGWSENSVPPDSVIESYWNKDGALCLSTPRRMDTTFQDVADECATVNKTLPLCDEIAPADYEWESRVPVPIPLPLTR